MAKASKGTLRGTRSKNKKGLRDKFKPETFIQEFKEGSKVIIGINPLSQKGRPHPRFVGK
ncbi:MAG: 50S ribosomal protein L21e, partial [Candidatus Aenigmatarchaeota archaeon]